MTFPVAARGVGVMQAAFDYQPHPPNCAFRVTLARRRWCPAVISWLVGFTPSYGFIFINNNIISSNLSKYIYIYILYVINLYMYISFGQMIDLWIVVVSDMVHSYVK